MVRDLGGFARFMEAVSFSHASVVYGPDTFAAFEVKH